LNEQHRIVAKLENLLEKVQSSQTRLEKIPALLKRFRQSVLAAACSGRLTADWREQSKPSIGHPIRDKNTDLPETPESWRWVKLPDTGEMSRGKSRHRPRNEPSLFDGQYPFIQTGDIAQSGGRITSHKQTYNEAGLAQSRIWPANTICITIAANIAESAILTYPACFPDSVVGIIADPKVCVAEYAEFFIRVAKADLSTFAPATAQKNINISILNELAVPLPPLTEQHEIVRRVEELFALANRIEARYQKVKVQVDKLTQSILAKAFRGELVPQDPNDEPASELFKRVKDQKVEDRPHRVPTKRKKRKT
jgi:type I restriction enzyme S subunit